MTSADGGAETFGLAGAVAAWGTPGYATLGPTEPLSEQAWRALCGVVREQRVPGLLARAIAEGDWPATEDQVEQARELHRASMATALAVERTLCWLDALLGEEALPYRVIKGPAAAHLDYPDPSMRSFGDLDVLVASRHIEAVRDLLAAHGGQRLYAEPRAGFDRRFSKGLSFRFAPAADPGVGGVDRVVARGEVDVHRTLALGPFGLTIDLEALGEQTEVFQVAGREVQAMDRPRRFVHACIHAVLGRAESRLVPLRDLVQTAPAGDAEIATVVALVRDWDLDVVLASALDAAAMRLAWTPSPKLVAWAAAVPASARERRWLASYVGEERSSARQSIEASVVAGRGRDRLAYVWAGTARAR